MDGIIQLGDDEDRLSDDTLRGQIWPTQENFTGKD